MKKTTRYLLSRKSGVKIPSSFTAHEIKSQVEFYSRQGMKEVSRVLKKEENITLTQG